MALDPQSLERYRRAEETLWKYYGFGSVAQARALVQTMPNATLEVIPDGGHLPWMDDPPHAAEYVRTFLTSPLLVGEAIS